MRSANHFSQRQRSLSLALSSYLYSHGFLSVQRRRAGTHDPCHREKTGMAHSQLSHEHKSDFLLQMQDFMRLYSGLVERCFTSCCNDFTSKTLGSKEVRAEGYMKCRKLLIVLCVSYDVVLCSIGAMCVKLHGQIPEILRTGWCTICGAQRRYVVVKADFASYG